MNLRAVARTIKDPAGYFRFQDAGKQRAYWHLSRRVLQRLSPRRQKAYEELLKATSVFSPIERDTGFSLQSGAAVRSRTQPACDEAADIIARADIPALRAKSKKPYLLKVLNTRTLSAQSEIVKLAFDSHLLRVAAEYLGCVPTLTYVDIWYSPNDTTAQLDGSQLFHLDHEDLTQLKCFVYIDDVGASQGPLRLLNAAASAELVRRIDYRTTESEKRVPDDQLAGEPVFTATGQKGSTLFADTSRCFHAGSRGGGKPRLAIVYQYLTPYAFVRQSYKARIPRIEGVAGLHPASRYLLRF
jgi:hypothetical protein